ncbi:hypothetical protein GH714_022073 [Hevea brasiliensis]|uniref:Exostosin GT47 domain-containing protein n=1 Tax=Hevea brasiliensis TaxID=3981 RepID=A0A6A6M2L8_HEVBR|nr:hypothetical protein GH714_022073 [Hevea brasiliensis]
MADKHVSSLGVVSRKYLLCLFSFILALFLLSWFLVLRSTGRPNSIDHSLLTKPFHSIIDNGSSPSWDQYNVELPLGNREGEGDEETPQEKVAVKEVKCNTHNENSKEPLKVYMYDLPPEFHFALLGWTPQGDSVWPDLRTKIPAYPGGLNLQHSIEYWLTLDLLASETPGFPRACGAIRVRNSSEADVIFVPFFSSLSYNRYSKGGLARQELFYLLKDEKDVHFQFGSVQKNGINKASKGMHSSKFCLNIAGDTPSSNRLFDAIASHCVPVIISDDIELPYEDVLDYSQFCIFVRTSDAIKEKFLVNMIRGIGKDEWTRMWQKLKEVEHFFEFQYHQRKVMLFK